MENEAEYIPLPCEETDAEREQVQYQEEHHLTLRTAIYALVVLVAVAVLLAAIFSPVLQISGNSMEPTLSDGDVVVLFKGEKFETGELVAFYYQNKLLIKRVIAEPGDVVNIDNEGNVYVNDELLDEPYVTEKTQGEEENDYPYQVQEGQYFVLGDNRATSNDSRSSAIGCIEADQIEGEIVLRIWPLDGFSLIN